MLRRARHKDAYAILWDAGPAQLDAAATQLAHNKIAAAVRHTGTSAPPPTWQPVPRMRLPRQRGNVPFDDSLPRPTTFFKLPTQ